ncbi:MAG: hypothetical protein HQL01_08650 [Nitrospirae bacterium]|nr:hypothetical protein [Nitrospirota bacterium]
MNAAKKDTDNQRAKPGRTPLREEKAVCVNKNCRLRKGGCKGFEGCPGYKTV